MKFRSSATVVTIAVITFFVLVLLCVLVNRWRSSSADADASAGGQQGFIRRRRRGLDPAAWPRSRSCRPHVTCPLCRANLENPVPPPVPLSSPETEPQAPEAVAVPVAVEDDEERKEEAVELEKLRCVRRAARMPWSRSTGHAVSTTVAAEVGDHERFTVRLSPRVREEVLKLRRLRHATSLVISLGGASDCAGSSTTCSVGGRPSCPGRRRGRGHRAAEKDRRGRKAWGLRQARDGRRAM
ncbi:E3 ubiquitin-protein ligase [Panicum miliaceum]|uniref:E3 ubiquitin-protein ligase n=1 Tax=Panicum miliaceum TaxID=4540 RepID=A0A3L6RW16_PANMI|nr:E3 ubiquitin-protein ligase [Panicum miliaceum]